MNRASMLAVLAIAAACGNYAYPGDYVPPIDASEADALIVDAPTDALDIDAPTDASPDASGPDCTLTPMCSSAMDLGMITADPHGVPQPYPVQVAYQSNGDPAWYRVRLMDTPAPGNLTAGITLMMNAGTNYDMRVYCVNCGGQLASIGDQVEATREYASVRRDDTASADTFDILIEVKRATGTLGCGPYQIVVSGNQPVGVVTCD